MRHARANTGMAPGISVTKAAPKRARLATEHLLVYSQPMKRRELERRLRGLGWRFLRLGGSHDVWTDGRNETALPRHAEIKEGTARGIIRYAERCAALKDQEE